MYDELSFGKAFKQAIREKGSGNTFTWRGKLYLLEYQDGGKVGYDEEYFYDFNNAVDTENNFSQTPVSENGLWEYPNREVIVPTNGSITMKGVDYPVLGRSMETGEQQMMYPDNEYFFEDTQNVYEIPQYQGGGQILNDEKVKEFYNDMLSSPLYKQRLEKNGYKKVDNVIRKRLNEVNKTALRFDNSQPISFERTLIGKTRIGTPYVNFNSSQIDDEDGHYNGVLAHEYGHGETTSVPLSDFERNQFQKKFKVQNVGSMSDQGLYMSSPEEAKSDINAIRYKLFEQGKFNPKTGEYDTPSKLFEPSLLKGNQDLQMRRMEEAYGEQGLTELMNIIAQNNNEEEYNTQGYM